MRLQAPLSLSLFYLTSFAVLGVYLPYFNLYMKSLGFTGAQIGAVTVLLPLSSALLPPLAGILADRSGRRRETIVLSSLLALVAFALILRVETFGPMVAVVAAYSALRAPALPLVEATAMEVAEAGGPPYGRMRAWGSLAFIVMALGTGPLVGLRGERAALYLMIVILAMNLLAAILLPKATGVGAMRPSATTMGALLRQPTVLWFLLACVLSQAAHGPYYVFYSIHLRDQGYRPQAIGVLWAIAVGCEIVAMLAMPRLLRRVGPLPTMGASVLLASVRWLICSASASPVAMAVAQSLHAATYAAFHVAAVTHTHRLFGERHRASGQALYSSAAYGVGNVLGMYLSGIFYDRTGMAQLFLAASAIALLSGLAVMAAARSEHSGRPRLYSSP